MVTHEPIQPQDLETTHIALNYFHHTPVPEDAEGLHLLYGESWDKFRAVTSPILRASQELEGYNAEYQWERFENGHFNLICLTEESKSPRTKSEYIDEIRAVVTRQFANKE